jgi:hypothetical protein
MTAIRTDLSIAPELTQPFRLCPLLAFFQIIHIRIDQRP